ncbi:hypothetical protein K1719_047146 [Acacia pycnantha]|nr:hypothetical protein K1719_047146 [Acacia pycnantha]
MTVLSVDNDKERHSVFVADSVGKQQVVSAFKGSSWSGENLYSLNKDTPQLESSVWAEGLSGVQQIISIATHGNVSAFMFKDHCIFRSLSSERFPFWTIFYVLTSILLKHMQSGPCFLKLLAKGLSQISMKRVV